MPARIRAAMRLVLGWKGDDGLGERLCRQVLEGRKTATCSPPEILPPDELAEALGAVGEVIPLVDGEGRQHGWVRKTRVFETTYGAPHELLWRGEGYESAAAFQASHRHVWDGFGFSPRPETVLLVETFEMAAAPSIPP